MPLRPARLIEPLGAAFVALAALQFGGVVVLGKVATRRGLPVPPMLAIRFAVAAALLYAVIVAARMPVLPASGERLRLAMLGVFGYAVEASLFFLAIERGTASAVTLLFFTYPVWVAILSVASGLGMPANMLLGALAASVAGAGLVVTASGGVDISWTGVAFVLASALVFAVYLLGAEAVLRRTSSAAGAMWVSASAAAGLGVYSFAAPGGRLPAGAGEWWPVIGMGAFTAGAFICLFGGLRRLGAVRTSIIASLEPVSGALLAVVFLGDPLRAGIAVGGVLILAGAVTATLARGDVASEPAAELSQGP